MNTCTAPTPTGASHSRTRPGPGEPGAGHTRGGSPRECDLPARERALGEAEIVGEADLHPDPLADVGRDRPVERRIGADPGLVRPVDPDPAVAVGRAGNAIDVGDRVGRRPQRLARTARPEIPGAPVAGVLASTIVTG